MKKWLIGFLLGAGLTCALWLHSAPVAAPRPQKRWERVNIQTAAASGVIAHRVASALQVNAPALISAAEAAEKGDGRQFDQAVYQLGDSLNTAVASSLRLSQPAKKELRRLLAEHYPEIAKGARESYVAQIKNLKLDTGRALTSTAYQTRADILSGAINGTVCQFANLVFIPMRINLSLSSNIAAGYVLADPCAYLLSGVTDKIGVSLYRTALVKDLDVTVSRLTQTKQSALAELTTYEMSFRVNGKETINRSLGTKQWTIKKWVAAELSIDYQASIKYGYDLAKGFTITRDDQQRIIFIKLPVAQMLNVTMEPLRTDAEDGGMPDLSDDNFKRVYSHAQSLAIAQAEKNKIKERAFEQAQVILSCIFGPFTRQSTFAYQIQYITNS